MQIINLTSKNVMIELGKRGRITISPTSEKEFQEPREGVVYICNSNSSNRKDIIVPRITISDECWSCWCIYKEMLENLYKWTRGLIFKAPFQIKIKDGIVTRDMLLHVIFAFNKRAKIYKEEEKNCYLFNFAKKKFMQNWWLEN